MSTKRTLTMAAAGIFASAGLAVAAANLTESVKSSNTTPEDTFNTAEAMGVFAGQGCDTAKKGTGLAITLTLSDHDFAAIDKAAWPAEMQAMTVEEKMEHLKSLPPLDAADIVQKYQQTVSAHPAVAVLQAETEKAVEAVLAASVSNNGMTLDRAQGASAFKTEFQKVADNVEKAGLSVQFDLQIVDLPAGDAFCAAQQTPAPKGPGLNP